MEWPVVTLKEFYTATLNQIRSMRRERENYFYHIYHVNSTMYNYFLENLLSGWTHTISSREFVPVRRASFNNIITNVRSDYLMSQHVMALTPEILKKFSKNMLI